MEFDSCWVVSVAGSTTKITANFFKRIGNNIADFFRSALAPAPTLAYA